MQTFFKNIADLCVNFFICFNNLSLSAWLMNKYICMKKFNLNKKVIATLFTNIIIIFAVFSVFSVCFWTDNSAVVSSTGYKAIYRGNDKEPNVSLCINVYWGTEYLDDMLKTLSDYNAKATFFIGGCWAAKNVDTLKKIYEGGHEIANHGYYHKDHKQIDYARNVQEIEYTHKLVKENLGIEMSLFMPPSGSYGMQTLEAAEFLGYTTIMWSKDTIDWRDKDADIIYKRATKNMQNGDLILMHPTECTKNALENIVKAYQQNGFNLVTVSQNISSM